MRPARPTIGILMLVVAVCAGFLAWVDSLGPLLVMPAVLATQSILGWAVASVAGYGVACAAGWKIRSPGRRVDARLAFVLLAVVTAYLAWAFHRCESYSSLLVDAKFPYPDQMINACERWVDARRPLPPQSRLIKIHGEYPLVTLILGILVLAHTAILGCLAGCLAGRGVARSRQGTS